MNSQNFWEKKQKDERFNIVLTKSRTMLHFHILFQVKNTCSNFNAEEYNHQNLYKTKPVGILEGLPKKNWLNFTG